MLYNINFNFKNFIISFAFFNWKNYALIKKYEEIQNALTTISQLKVHDLYKINL